MPNANFDPVLTTTLKNYVPTLTDNIFSARPLAFWLKSNDRIRMEAGGASIVIPIINGLNTTAGSYAGYDTLSISAQTGITAAEFQWKQFSAQITISGIEEAKNNSTEQIINLLEGKIQQAQETIIEKMDIMFFADGTGNSAKDWNGLSNLVKSSGTLGGIDPTVDTTWKSYTEATAEALSLAKMNTAYNTVSVGNDHPDLILTTQALYEKYEALLQPQERFVDAKTADGGFENIAFKGAPVVFDVNQTTGRVDFLNSKYLTLVGHSDRWGTVTPFNRPETVDARYASIFYYGELTISNRARQGYLTAKT